MGLLQKAKEQTASSPEIRRDIYPKIRERLSLVQNKIEFYPILFRELIPLFSIEKGALLIRDGDNYMPSSIIGYDETTGNRLRITHKEFNTFNNDKKLENIQKYFSIREFVTISDITIIPFENKNEVKGLILISEFSSENHPTTKELFSYVKKIEDLWEENPFEKLKQMDAPSRDIKESISSFVQRIKNSKNRIIFLKLNLSDLLEKLRKDNSLLTNSSIKNSAIKILSSFVQKRGKVFQLVNNDILITLLDNQGTISITVIQQQINAAFKSIFSNKLNSVDLNYESLIWKDNSIDTILDHFIPDAPAT
ncbi:MAG: hypothetical protein B6229_08405 [Spirochaetaceae bacterium 4572_7]|nr:MAG: hypothetical protein B6229_08405 [Spirochaetaceae bacterium 4572_7]